MGKKSTPQVEVTEYYMSDHFGVCIGPVDAITRAIIKEKVAWEGEQADPGSFVIDNRELFGGVKKEGGVAGIVVYMPGNADQVVPDGIAAKLGRGTGANCPAFRGITTLFFTGRSDPFIAGLTGIWAIAVDMLVKALTKNYYQPGFYWTANTPYLPGVWTTVRRILKRSDGSTQWYPDKAAIPSETTPVTPSVLTRHSAGWKYKLEPYNTVGSNYSSPSYDDSAWSTGPAPFFEGVDHPSADIQAWGGFATGTDIGFNQDIWMRRTITATAGSQLTITVAVDNNPSVWLNGVPVPLTTSVSSWVKQGTVIMPASSAVLVVYCDEADGPTGRPNSTFCDCEVTASAIGGADMNPAHIIRECLTDTNWGMGSPETGLDDASFTAAADTLFYEGFGLSMLWTRQTSIEEFVGEVLDHIQGVLFIDPTSGLLTLKLIRGDYDPDTLLQLNPDNCDITRFERKLWGEITNEIVVTWTNPVNEQDETVVAQDIASIATQGGIVSNSRNYYGVRSASLAKKLGMRDLRTSGAPLCAIDAEVNRSAYQIRPASVVKVNWPEHGLDDVIMRVLEVDYGRPGDMTISVKLIEDVFGLDAGAYVAPEGSQWTDPSSPPTDAEEVEILTLPLFFAANSVVAVYSSSPTYPEVVAGVLTNSTNADVFEAELWDEATLGNGSTAWVEIGALNIIGRAELAAPLNAETSTAGVTFSNLTGMTSATVAGFVLIGEAGETGNEIAMVNTVGSGVDLIRGVLDTVPRAWPIGTKVWFVDGSTLIEDRKIRSASEVVDYKVRTRSSQGLLPLESATLHSATLSDRPWLPNRPANVTAYGQAWSSQASPIDARTRTNPWVTVSWANRNRLEEDSQVLSWTDATVTPEVGQTTTIEVRDWAGTLLATHAGLSGTTFDVPDASFGGAQFVELRVLAARSDADGDFVSLQYFSHWLMVEGATRQTEADETRYTEDGVVRLTED